MGYDTHVSLLLGYRLPLQEAFDAGWLSEEIMENDDWQLSYRQSIVDTHVNFNAAPGLEQLLTSMDGKGKGWKLLILASLQDDYRRLPSYIYIYRHKHTLFDGRDEYEVGAPERLGTFGAGAVPEHMLNIAAAQPATTPAFLTDCPLKLHWLVQNSW